MMNQFNDLSDEIEVGDWLIPEQEIGHRRLVRETPRFRVYKADWFGDVTVYESKVTKNNARQDKCPQHEADQDMQQQQQQQQIDQQLRELSLNFCYSDERLTDKRAAQHQNYHNQTQQYGPPSPGAISTSSSTDSAYSSVSSTPRYLTKKPTEFEFPELSQINLNEDNLFCDEQVTAIDDSCQLSLTSRDQFKEIDRSSSDSKPKVVLNRSSFEFGGGCAIGESDDQWLELNELRLIAHDNFILFMGFSMSHSSWEANESVQHSLVMQTIHPKSESLFNLLHKGKLTSSNNSTLEVSRQLNSSRFCANKSLHQRQPLTIEAKLNICQQVTNAMTYLHEKDIVHARLTSTNIYIELNERVKISLIDDGERPVAAAVEPLSSADAELNRLGYCKCRSKFSFDKMTLTYLSPELVRTIQGAADRHCDQCKKANKFCGELPMDTTKLTKSSDVFSFGTLLFELFEERFPFSTEIQTQRVEKPDGCLAQAKQTLLNPYRTYATQTLLLSFGPDQLTGKHRQSDDWNGNITKTSASELIFQIGSGQIDALNPRTKSTLVRCSSTALVDQIISSCWATNPHERPKFKQMKFSSKIY